MGMVEGIWVSVDVWQLVTVAVVATVLPAVLLVFTSVAGRLSRLDRGDKIVLLFCGSKKSLHPDFRWRWCCSLPPQSD